MKERFLRFMRGRYGVDAFGKLLIYVGLMLALINLLFHNIVLFAITLIIWFYAYFRMFSRDIYRRSSENTRYLHTKACITGGIRGLGERIKAFFGQRTASDQYGRKENFRSRCNSYSGNCYEMQYKVFKCPKCKQKLRVPRGKGKIRIICRRCKYEFVRRS